MQKNDRLKIIDAIEQASEAELRQLALINDSLGELAGRSGPGAQAVTTTAIPATDDAPELVITRRLSRADRGDKKSSEHEDNSGIKSAVARDEKGALSAPASISDPEEADKEQNSTVEKDIRNQKSTEDKKDNQRGTARDKNVPYKGTKQQQPGITEKNERIEREYHYDRERERNTSTYTASADTTSNTTTTHYRDRLTGAGGDRARRNNEPGERPRNPKPARPARATDEKKSSDPRRGANGRFLSRDEAESAEKIRQQKLSQKEQEKMQTGFFGRLGKLLSGDDEKGSKGVEGAGGELVGGAVVGGPIWTLAKGTFDMGKAVTDNAMSIKQWVSGKDDDDKDKEHDEPEPAKTQAPVIVQPPAPPALGEPKSAAQFANGSHDPAVAATVEQTRVIDENDDRIVEELDGIRREIKRQGKGGEGMAGLKSLLGRRSMSGRNGRNGRNARNGKDASRGRSADKGKTDKGGKNSTSTRSDSEKGKRPGKSGQPDSPKTERNRTRTSPDKAARTKTPGTRAPGGKLKAILTGKAAKVAGGVAATGALTTAAAAQLPEKAAAVATEKAAAQAAKTAAPAARATEKAITAAAKPAAAVVGTGTAAAGTTAAAKAVTDAGAKAAESTATKTAETASKTAVKTAEITTTKVAETTATKTAETTATKTAETTATKTAETTATKTATKTAETTATKTATEAGEAATKKGALSVGSKLGAKTALKAIPLIGTAIGVGLDAYEGINDEEGQRDAFKVEEGKQVSTQQKSAFTMANVINMGGLVSGAAGLLASGASAVGMDKVADALTFDTASIAKGLDSGMTSVRDAVTKVTESSDGQSKAVTKALSDQTLAINAGTDKTVGAINRLGTQMQGGEWGKDNVGVEGKNVSDYTSVTTNSISPDLNIGGKNAKVRSFRNNNFGNLNFVGQEGARLEDPNGNGEARFAKFNTPEEGFRGLANQLTLYANGKSKATGGRKLETVEDIINVYAPSNENNTQQYVSSLSTKLGVKSNEKLDMTNPEVMTQLMRGIATIEGGNPQVTDQFIRDAIGQHQDGKWVGGKFSEQSLKVVNEERAKKGLAPVAANSLYSSGSKVITAQGGADPVRPAVSDNAPVATAAVVPPPTAPAQPVTPPAPPAPVIVPAPAAAAAPVKTSMSPITSAAAATHPPTIAAPAAAANAASSTATQTLSAAVPVAAAAGGEAAQPLSAKQHEAQEEKREKAKEVKGAAGEDSITSRFKSMLGKGMAAASGAVGQGDAWVLEVMQEKGIEGMSKNRPDAGLTLPAGVKLPAVLADAARTPAEIAKRTRATSEQQISAMESAAPVSSNPTSIVAGKVMPAGPTTGAETELSKVSAGATTVPGASATPQEPGVFDRAMSGAMDGLKAVGASIMPAIGDTLNQTVSGFSGTQVIGDLMGQAGMVDPSVQRAIAPITDKAGNWLEGGVDTLKGASTALFTGQLFEGREGREGKEGVMQSAQAMTQPHIREQPSSLAIPAAMQSVQDLARSGVRTPLSSDNIANYDVDMLKELKAMSGTLEQLLGVSKQKDDAPAKVVNTAQPAPRKDAALSIKDDALSELLRD